MDETKIIEGVTDAIEKSVPSIVDSAVDKKVTEAMAKTVSELEDIKTELKAAKALSMKSDTKAFDAARKTAVVSIIKEAVETGANSEKAFKAIVDKTVKAMSEGTATEGAELVFDQFETDILRVINTFDLVNAVRILPLAKGDKVSLPKATNGVTTYFVAEGVAYTESEAETAFVVIDIAKACTLTDMTQELLDDSMTVPDLYDLLVEFIGESQASFLEDQIINGTGAVEGILQNADINEVALAATETSADISDDDLVAVMTSIAKKFGKNKSWIMSQYIYGKILALKTLDGYPLYPELRNFENPSLMGRPVIVTDGAGLVQDAVGDVADATIAIFGDLTRFTLVRRKGITLERGYHGDNWKKDIPSLKSNQRYGGAATFGEAFTALKNGAVS